MLISVTNDQHLAKNTARVTDVESSIHCLAEPDVLAVLALATPPVLAWDA